MRNRHHNDATGGDDRARGDVAVVARQPRTHCCKPQCRCCQPCLLEVKIDRLQRKLARLELEHSLRWEAMRICGGRCQEHFRAVKEETLTETTERD